MKQEQLRSKFRTVWEGSRQSEQDYWLMRFVFLRVLGFTYFFAYLSLFMQLMPLLGSNGLTPVKSYLPPGGFRVFMRLPTVFWFNQSDAFMVSLAVLGLFLSLLVLLGFANVPMLLVNWFIYLSFVNVGQVWYGYGWEIQLLETGLLAVFFVPLFNPRPFPELEPPPLMVWLLRWLSVRVHLGSGLIKLKGVECWERLTCLDRFFQTQPIPNPVSPWMHHLPLPLHKLGALYTHVVQLFAPVTAVFEDRYRMLRNLGGAAMLSLQLILVLVGNFAFLNWVTIAAIISFFDDRFLARFLPDRLVTMAEDAKESSRKASDLRHGINILVVAAVAVLSIPVLVNLVSPGQAMNTSFNSWHFVNTYGAFGSVRPERTGLVVEGTQDANLSNGADWREYDFRYKPDQVDDPLPVVAPYQPRIAWQFWFASMSSPEQEPWLMHLTWKLLHNDPRALELVKHNPFPGEAPRYIRIRIYRYEMQPPLARQNWERTLEGTWLPPVSRNSTGLRRYLERRWDIG